MRNTRTRDLESHGRAVGYCVFRNYSHPGFGQQRGSACRKLLTFVVERVGFGWIHASLASFDVWLKYDEAVEKLGGVLTI